RDRWRYPIRCAKISHGRVAGQLPVRFTRPGGPPQWRRRRRDRPTEEAAVSGEIVHIEIPADDTANGQRFWGSLFGWQFQANPGPFEYHTGQIEGPRTAAITNMEPGKRGTRPYFAVDDIRAGAARVNELGGQAGEPAPVPGLGWFATCTDPHGNEF